jgi:hypothetical protein
MATIFYLSLMIVCGFAMAMVIDDEDTKRIAKAGWGTKAIFISVLMLFGPIFFVISILKEILKAFK